MGKKYFQYFRWYIAFIFFLGWNSVANGQIDIAVADGFATGTTGGAGGRVITVRTEPQLRAAVGEYLPAIIIVANDINLGTKALYIKSNKTVIGDGAGHTIIGNIRLSSVTNVIIQNLNITNPTGISSGDGIEVRSSTMVLITKCTFIDCKDGAVDIVLGSDFITLSWCRFSYPTQTEHNFANLIGQNDTLSIDRGKLHVTMHHNWYDDNVQQRMPRVRFGKVHCYNVYFGTPGGAYSNIGVGVESQILLENCYFENQRNPWRNQSAFGIQGKIQWSNLCMVGTGYPSWAQNSKVFEPAFWYSYSLDEPCDVKDIVMNGAGAGAGYSTAVVKRTEPDPESVLFPNPVKEELTISFTTEPESKVSIQILDITGKLIITKQLNSKDNSVINMRELPKGVYLIRILHQGVASTKRIIKL